MVSNWHLLPARSSQCIGPHNVIAVLDVMYVHLCTTVFFMGDAMLAHPIVGAFICYLCGSQSMTVACFVTRTLACLALQEAVIDQEEEPEL
eukprot:1139201-Pelagomonas_calceolata.AAC.2